MEFKPRQQDLIIPQQFEEKSPFYRDIVSSTDLTDIIRLSKNEDNNIDYIYQGNNRSIQIDRGNYIVIIPDEFTLDDVVNGTTKFVQEWILRLYTKTRQREITFDIRDYFTWRKNVTDNQARRQDFFNSLCTLRDCSYKAFTKKGDFRAIGTGFISDFKITGDFVNVELGKYFKEDFLDVTKSIAQYPERLAWLDADKDRIALQIARYLYPLASMNYEGKGKPTPYVSISKVLEATDLPTEEELKARRASPIQKRMEPCLNALYKLDEEGAEIMYFDLLDPETKKPLSDKDYYSIVFPPEGTRANYKLFKKCYLAFQFYEFDTSGAKTKAERRKRRQEYFKKAAKTKKKAAKK